MQQLKSFIKISESLYQLGTEPVYVYLPEKCQRTGDEAEALDLYRRGAVFVYLRYAVDVFTKQLGLLVEAVYGRATTLFVDNQGEYAQNWDTWNWSVGDVKYGQSRLLSFYGYDVLIPQNALFTVDEEGIHIPVVRLGKKRTEKCREAVLSWNGQFRCILQAGDVFREEVQIRYVGELYGNREKMVRRFVYPTGEPRWKPEEIEVEVNLCWTGEEKAAFIFPENVCLSFSTYPPVKMETCMLRFTRGIGEYYLVMSGKGSFLDDADVAVGSKGIFRITKGDKVEVVIVPEGYIGTEDLSVEVSALRLHAPFYASGVELEPDHAVPVFPGEGSGLGNFVRKRLDRKLQEIGVPVYHKDIWFGRGMFDCCFLDRNILWYSLYAAEETFPGISLCHVEQKLAHVLLSDEYFAVLDHHAIDAFTVPYTIDSQRIRCAEQMGYPGDRCERLAKCYPAGQTFLEESTFRQAVGQAGCPYTEEIRAACHHYRVPVNGREISFPPEGWKEQGIFLVIKKGRSNSVSEWAEDAEIWGFPSEDIEAEQTLLKKICGEKRAAAWKPVVGNPEWEGSIVVCTGKEQDGWNWLLALQAKTGEVVFDDRSEETALTQK